MLCKQPLPGQGVGNVSYKLLLALWPGKTYCLFSPDLVQRHSLSYDPSSIVAVLFQSSLSCFKHDFLVYERYWLTAD